MGNDNEKGKEKSSLRVHSEVCAYNKTENHEGSSGTRALTSTIMKTLQKDKDTYVCTCVQDVRLCVKKVKNRVDRG